MNFIQILDQIFLNNKRSFLIIYNYFRNQDCLKTFKKSRKNLDNILSSLKTNCFFKLLQLIRTIILTLFTDMFSYEVPEFFLRYGLDFLSYRIAKVVRRNEDYQTGFDFTNNILLQIYLDYNIVIILVFFIVTSYSSNSYISTKLIPDFLSF